MYLNAVNSSSMRHASSLVSTEHANAAIGKIRMTAPNCVHAFALFPASVNCALSRKARSHFGCCGAPVQRTGLSRRIGRQDFSATERHQGLVLSPQREQAGPDFRLLRAHIHCRTASAEPGRNRLWQRLGSGVRCCVRSGSQSTLGRRPATALVGHQRLARSGASRRVRTTMARLTEKMGCIKVHGMMDGSIRPFGAAIAALVAIGVVNASAEPALGTER